MSRTHRGVGEGEVVGFGRLCSGAGGLKPCVKVTAMVWHDVEDVAHVALAECVAQLDEGVVAAEMGSTLS